MADTPLPVDLPDEVLVARVARGDAEAFAALYDRYARPVYALAAHLLGVAEAEEAAQEVFLRLWRRADQFDPARGVFAAWFMTIARHHVRAQLRQRGHERQIVAVGEVEAALSAIADPSPAVEDIVWQEERGAAVQRALLDLPAEQRQAVVLAYFGGQSQRAIAEDLGWPLGTVKKRLQLAMKKLRRALIADGAVALEGAQPSNGRDPAEELAPSGGQER